MTAFDVWGTTLRIDTPAALLSSANAVLATAIGSNSAVAGLVAGLPNERIAASASSFVIDEPLSRTGTVTNYLVGGRNS